MSSIATSPLLVISLRRLRTPSVFSVEHRGRFTRLNWSGEKGHATMLRNSVSGSDGGEGVGGMAEKAAR
jgi:hypothetical protein